MPIRLLAHRRQFRHALLAWYRAHARRLPWREQPSLYKTVVSEFMLQQTQVKTVLPFFARWLSALPDFPALAAAPEAQVLKLWEGLGYYSRARRLHQLARTLVAAPAPPRTVAAWRELPGIGPYTAAAIASIAFGERAACVDGNVVRILARLTANRTRHRNASSAARRFEPLAAALLSSNRPGDFNQAMMELGATVCARQWPLCPQCPVRRFCAAVHTVHPERYPRFARRTIERRHVIRLWCERNGKLLLHRIPSSARRLAGISELPTAAHLGLDDASAASGPLLARHRRSITRYSITESIHLFEAPPAPGTLPPNLHWAAIADLPAITLSGPHRRWIEGITSLPGRILTRESAGR